MMNLLSVPTEEANSLTMWPIFLDVDCSVKQRDEISCVSCEGGTKN